MELNALTRWESIGKDLYARGQLGSEIERIKQFSLTLSQARQKQRRDRQRRDDEDEEKQQQQQQQQSLSEITEEAGEEKGAARRRQSSEGDDGAAPDSVQTLPALYTRVYPAHDERIEEERRLQDAIERKELDDIPRAHAKLLFFLYRAARRFGKGFAVGYVGKLLFGLVSSLLRSRGELSLFWRYSRSLFLRRDVTGYGLFLGGFLAVFESLMRLLKAYKERFRPRLLRVVLSSAAAGLCFLFLPEEYRVSLSMFFFVRALEICGSYCVEHRLAPAVPHGDTALMAAASSAVIWCWLFHRSALDASYAHFLDIQGAKPRWLTEAYRLCHYGNAALFAAHPAIDVLQQQRMKLRLPPVSVLSPSLRCDILHPSQSHTAHMLSFLRDGFLRALPVYVPVYLLPLLVFRMRDIVSRPLLSLALGSFSILRSSLFLSSYCTACWYSACLATSYLHSTSNLNGVIAGFCGGCTVLIEKSSRRIELALYVLAQAIPTVCRVLQARGLLPVLPHGEAVIFVLSIAVIMSAYIVRPHLLRRSYLSLLLFFFGSGGRNAGFHTRKQLDSPLLSASDLKAMDREDRQLSSSSARTNDRLLSPPAADGSKKAS